MALLFPRDAGPLEPPFARESGILVSTQDDGEELRLHLATASKLGPRYEAKGWYKSADGDIVCYQRFYMTPEEWRACGLAMANL